jgi:hypothetical protein
MIYDLRFFLTKQLTFLRPSFLYTIYYSVLMNVFQKLGNYTRFLRYTAKNNFAAGQLIKANMAQKTNSVKRDRAIPHFIRATIDPVSDSNLNMNLNWNL